MSAFDDALAVLANNRSDILSIVQRLGLAEVIDLAPSIIRIATTLSKRKQPVPEAEHIERVLYYNEKTRDRVMAFQASHGLHVDGLIGDQTWTMVEKTIEQLNNRVKS